MVETARSKTAEIFKNSATFLFLTCFDGTSVIVSVTVMRVYS